MATPNDQKSDLCEIIFVSNNTWLQYVIFPIANIDDCMVIILHMYTGSVFSCKYMYSTNG